MVAIERMRAAVVVLLFLVASVGGGCASPAARPDDACAEPSASSSATAAAAAPAAKSLYERLGGLPAITAVVDTFLGKVAADARINHFFATADVPRLRGHLIDQICAATGGPCTYKGRDMKTTHRGMRVDDAAFGALVEDLVAALDHHQVPAQEKGELLAALAAMRGDIVQR